MSSLAEKHVAIVGLACRFPGAPDEHAFWELIERGAHTITEIPSDRWEVEPVFDPKPGVVGKMSARYGGFIERFAEFDAEFFGINAREARIADPQQRVMLELAWRAIENAGLDPKRLAATRCGVYMGVSTWDYNKLLNRDLNILDGYVGTGSSLSIMANRVSYQLDLRGPSMAVDTACSSSLVAMHLATQSLRTGESDCALVGGVNLMLSPETNITFSVAGFMSPVGRCKTFAADADGYVRSEGAAVLVLKRLQDAVADGDPIWGVLRGTAINQDGASNGLTAPSGPAQQAVIRAALSDAGVAPADVAYVELHGTGTPIGDPIEVRALATVMREQRGPSQPCHLGAVKANIGHCEAAAGMAGVIKVLQCLQHGRIPAQPSFGELNPHVASALAGTALRVAREPSAWPRTGSPRIASVSSFGFGGVNAHVVIEEPPSAAERPTAEPEIYTLKLTAACPDALRALAVSYRAALEQLGDDAHGCAAFCATASAQRSDLRWREVVLADSPAVLRAELERLCAAPQYQTAKLRLRSAWLLPGGEAYLAGAGRDLYEHAAPFRAAFERCARVLTPELSLPLEEIVFGEGPDATFRSELRGFVLGYCLTQLYGAWGLEPSVVSGVGVGEYVACVLADVMPLAAALQLVLAGARKRDPSAFGVLARAIHYRAPSRPIMCSLTGALAQDDTFDAEHFERRLSQPTAAHAIDALLARDVQLFLEVGPPGTQPAHGDAVLVQGPLAVLDTYRAAAEVYRHGGVLDWSVLCRAEQLPRVRVPSYPFQGQRHWVEFSKQPVSMAPTVLQRPVRIPVEHTPELPEPPAQPVASIRERLQGQTAAEQCRAIEVVLVEIVSRMLNIDPATIPINDELNEQGLDSLLYVEIQLDIERQLGIELSTIELTEYRRIDRLAAFLRQKMYGAAAEPHTAPVLTSLPVLHATQPSAAVSAPREQTVALRGRQRAYIEWGPRDAPTVVLVHGILDQALAWEPVALPLSQLGYRVIAPDLRGHGLSEPGDGYSLLALAADLADLVQHLELGRFTLAGHSLGSLVSVLFTACLPEHVDGLVLVETMLLAGTEQRGMRELLLQDIEHMRGLHRHGPLPSLDVAIKLLRRGSPNLDEALARRLCERGTKPAGQELVWRWDPILRTRLGLRFPGSRAQYLELLSELKSPVRLLFGDKSGFNRTQEIEQLLAALPQREIHWVDGGHNLHFDRPAAIVEAVRAVTTTQPQLQPARAAGIPLSPVDYVYFEKPQYTMNFAFDFATQQDYGAMRESLAAVLTTFHPLRCRIIVNAAGRCELVDDTASPLGALLFECRELTAAQEPEDGAALLELACREAVSACDGDPVAKFVLYQLPHRSILCTSVTHAIADGFSYFFFLASWAAATRGITLPPPAHQRHLVRHDGDDYGPLSASAVFERTGYSLLNRPALDPPRLTRYERIFVAELDLTRERERASAELGQKVSRSDVLTALMLKDCATRWHKPGDLVRLTCQFDWRRLLPAIEPTFFGNGVRGASLDTTYEQIATSSVSQLAAHVKTAVARIDAAAVTDSVRCLHGIVEQQGLSATRRLHVWHPDHGTMVTNLTRMPLDQIDFGRGGPQDFYPGGSHSPRTYLLLARPLGVEAFVGL